MADAVLQELLHQLNTYLAGTATLKEVWQWLMKNIWATEEDRRDPVVASIAQPLLLFLSEYQAGHRTMDEAREFIRGFVWQPIND